MSDTTGRRRVAIVTGGDRIRREFPRTVGHEDLLSPRQAGRSRRLQLSYVEAKV